MDLAWLVKSAKVCEFLLKHYIKLQGPVAAHVENVFVGVSITVSVTLEYLNKR